MTTTQKKWTVNEIKEAMRAAGSHWFDPDTMRCFGTRVLGTVYQGRNGIYFVTEDNQYRRELPKRFTVRQFDPANDDISTVGTINDYATASDAIDAAKDLARSARGELEEITEAFKPVTTVEQFTEDMQKHGNGTADTVYANRLMRFAKRHHGMMEAYCNGAEMYDAEGEPCAMLRTLRERITADAAQIGATVIFQGDPRGCTVKLVFADGFTNDFAHEGYCVPTE